jgi:hypothetical protein
LFDFW